jgi:hypothetical protein
VCRLIEDSLASHEEALAAACRAANQDSELDREIEDWQAFNDENAEDVP